jgi:hypothetical protein
MLALGLTSCTLPQVSAESRLFLDVSLEFLGEYDLPKQDFDGTPVGGLSAIAYDGGRDRFYALSDDRSVLAPARFYTLNIDWDQPRRQIQAVQVEDVTLLQDQAGDLYARNSIDPEGMALTPRNTLLISSEGVPRAGALPFIAEYDLAGNWLADLRIPSRYLPDPEGEVEQGIQENLGFEALTTNWLGATGSGGNPAWVDPFRVFTATESALIQDINEDPAVPPRNRFLHYLLDANQSTLISEHLYPMSLAPFGGLFHGLSALSLIDQGGHFLSLERTFGLTGFTVKLFQLASGGATDTSSIASFSGDLGGIAPIRKQLILDLTELGIPLDNLEGMTLGPPLADGGQSLILVSDDNFDDNQINQFLLFRLDIS